MSQLHEHPSRLTYSAQLKADNSLENTPRKVVDAAFSYVAPVQSPLAKVIHVSQSLLNEFDLDNKLDELSQQMLSGSASWPGCKPYAMCYGGHQFGNWAGQLGDGRAINVAEIDFNTINWKFQLKGSGPTPYSRTADGFAVLRSSIREYLCSEAMQALGVPTTRALSLGLTGRQVLRDVMYNGNAEHELGAIVCRVAPSFVRFGNFEILAARKEHENLKALADYVIDEHYHELKADNSRNVYLNFFEQVVRKSMAMVLHWQRVGFVHGVMNTDNMSILGLTIDYGPYGWLENYDAGWTPNTTDSQHKRYRYGNQANVTLWNLVRLANALFPLINEAEPLQEILDKANAQYGLDYHEMMCAKLGLYNYDSISPQFIEELSELLERFEVDMTLFFRLLSSLNLSDGMQGFLTLLKESSYQDLAAILQQDSEWESWFNQFTQFVLEEGVIDRSEKMNRTNPKYVLRNYMAQLAIDKAESGDYSLIEELYSILLQPYEEQPEAEKWFAKRPDWAKEKIGCSMLSCSS